MALLVGAEPGRECEGGAAVSQAAGGALAHPDQHPGALQRAEDGQHQVLGDGRGGGGGQGETQAASVWTPGCRGADTPQL